MPSNQNNCNNCGCTPTNPLDSGNWESESTAGRSTSIATAATAEGSPSVGPVCEIGFRKKFVAVKIDDETYSAASNLHPTNCKKDEIEWSIALAQYAQQRSSISSSCEATIDSEGTVTFGASGELDDVGVLCGETGDTMKLAIADVRIEYRRTDGQDFDVTDPLPGKGEPTPFKVRAGQQIYLGLKLKPTMTLESNTWEIPSRAIADYISGQNKGEIVEIKPAEYSNESIRFYWCDVGKKTVKIDVFITINGDVLNIKRTATFEVTKPEISFTGRLNTSTFIPEFFPPDIVRSVASHLGTFTRTGDPADGKCAWTQIVGFSGAVQPGNRTYSVEGVDDEPTIPDNTPGALAWHDLVQIGVPNPPETSYSAARNFDLWLMYQCEIPGSIWVPLAKASWRTDANATWDGDKWVKGAFTPTTNPAILIPPVPSSPTDQFPLWDKRVTAAEIMHKLGLQ